jgi:RNA polymerase sigma-70 factor (ECF subfamily)
MFDRDALNRLYRYAYALTADEAGAYDLLQDAVERVLRAEKPNLRNPEAYARSTLRNCFYDECRRQHRYQEDTGVDTDAIPIDLETRSLESVMIAEDELAFVWHQLDPVDREILYLLAVEGMSAQQIADALDSRRGTILSRIHRVRIRLKKLSGTGSRWSELQ